MKKNVKFSKVRSFVKTLTVAAIFMAAISDTHAQKAEVKLFAHRGGVLEYDENTIQAFQETYNKGIRGYEIDIRITKDGHLVIFHDETLDRIVGLSTGIEKLTLKEIKGLKTKKGNVIPTLDEVLTFFNDKPGLYVEFEMKTNKPVYDEKTLLKYCDDLYAKVHAAKPSASSYVLTSFDKKPLTYLKTKYPAVDLLFIKAEALNQSVLDEAKAMGIKRLGCRVEKTTREMVQSAKKQGFSVSLWPGKSVDDFLLGLALGSDYLCSDVPVAVTEWVKTNGSWITLK